MPKRLSEQQWNVLLTGISAVAAVISLFVAASANRRSDESLRLAAEANQIALRAISADIDVQFLGRIYSHERENTVPCYFRLEGGGHSSGWSSDSGVILQLSNKGSTAISVTGLRNSNGVIDSGSSIFSMNEDRSIISSREDFDDWRRDWPDVTFSASDKMPESGLGHPLDAVVASLRFDTLPRKIESGESIWIVMRSYIFGTVEQQVSLRELARTFPFDNKPYQLASWTLSASFGLSNGSDVSTSWDIEYPNWIIDPESEPYGSMSIDGQLPTCVYP